MRIILFIISLTILFSGCVPKVTTSTTIKDTKIDNELIKDLNKFSSNDIELKNSWWKDFNDEQLNILIENAMKNAPSLKQLEAKYQKANNIIKAKKSSNLPNVNFESQATRQRFSENYIFPEPLGGNYYNLYQTGLNLEYDFDFWNQRASLIKASKNEALAQDALIKVKQLAISTSISKLYISWNFKIEKLKKLSTLKKLIYEKHHILNELYNMGLSNKEKVNESNYLIEKINQDTLTVNEEIENIKNSIAVIAGLLPSQINKLENPSISNEYKISIPKDIHLNIVSHLPEVAVQKYLLASKEQYIENAKSKFYPNIRLSGLLHFTSFPFSQLLKESSFDPEAGVAFSLPIFDAKRRESNLNTKVNDYNAQVYAYNETIIKAVNNIVTTLKKIQLNNSQEKSEKIVISNKNKNKNIEKRVYELGIKNKINFINKNIELEEEKIKEIALQDKKFQLHIDLIEALGGGYKNKAKDVLSSK